MRRKSKEHNLGENNDFDALPEEPVLCRVSAIDVRVI